MDIEQVKHSILAADDLPISEKIPTPEWAPINEVYVRTLMADELAAVDTMEDSANGFGEFAALVLCSSGGDRLFKSEDAEAIGKKNPVVLQRIATFGLTHNGIGKSDRDEMVKNSEMTSDDG